jgi:hypothetical protein
MLETREKVELYQLRSCNFRIFGECAIGPSFGIIGVGTMQGMEKKHASVGGRQAVGPYQIYPGLAARSVDPTKTLAALLHLQCVSRP